MQSDMLQVNLCQKLFFLQNMLCTKIVLNVKNNFCTQHVLPRFELGIFMYWTCNSMNNLSSYCGLVDAKIKASDKDEMNQYFVRRPNLFAMFYKLDSFLNIYYSQEEIFSRQNGFNFFHQLQRVQISSRSRKNLSCRADFATAQHTSRSCEFISKHEIFLSRWRKKISQRKSVWLLAFGKEAKPFGKSS